MLLNECISVCFKMYYKAAHVSELCINKGLYIDAYILQHNTSMLYLSYRRY